MAVIEEVEIACRRRQCVRRLSMSNGQFEGFLIVLRTFFKAHRHAVN